MGRYDHGKCEWQGPETLRHLPYVGWYKVGSLVEYRDGTRAIVTELDPDREPEIAVVLDLFGSDPVTDGPMIGASWDHKTIDR
jgi:hypothetical protein